MQKLNQRRGQPTLSLQKSKTDLELKDEFLNSDNYKTDNWGMLYQPDEIRHLYSSNQIGLHHTKNPYYYKEEKTLNNHNIKDYINIEHLFNMDPLFKQTALDQYQHPDDAIQMYKQIFNRSQYPSLPTEMWNEINQYIHPFSQKEQLLNNYIKNINLWHGDNNEYSSKLEHDTVKKMKNQK